MTRTREQSIKELDVPRRRNMTVYIRLDSRRCKACGTCVEGCPQRALGMVNFLWHRHACIEDAKACKGCLKCVKNCPEGAIMKRTNM